MSTAVQPQNRSKIVELAERIGQQRHLMSIRDGVVAALPFVIIGSAFLLIAVPPVPAWDTWARAHPAFKTPLLMAVNGTMGMVSLIVAFACAFSLARRYDIDGLSTGVMSVVSFLVASLPFLETIKKGDRTFQALPLDWFGPQGMFVAIVLALFAAEVSRFFIKRNWVFRLPESVPDTVLKSFLSMAPGFAVIATVWLVTHVLHINIFFIITLAISPFLKAVSSLPGALVIVLLDSVIWLFGVHPVALMAPVIAVWLTNIAENARIVQSGGDLQSLSLATREFFVWFIWLGGSGVSLCLPFLYLRARSAALKSIGKVGMVSAIFNINDPVVFGTPIVMNMTLAVPFIVAPVICCLTTWFAFAWKLVQIPYLVVPWTLPAPIGAYLSTGGDWRAVLLMAINLAIATVMYIPFVRAYDRKLAAQEAATAKQ